MTGTDPILGGLPALLPTLEHCYVDLHAHPELSSQEIRTAGIVAASLSRHGYRTLTGVGGTGVVGVLGNGPGPVVMLRADMDALPVREETGLDYASTVTVPDARGALVPVMHACGHDMHVTCLLGAAELLATSRNAWKGTVIVVFQPAEETGVGAQAMVDDGLFERVPLPEIVLGQHVAPQPAGLLLHRAGPILAAADTLEVTLHGRGAHASAPELGVDPILLAASVITRLHTIVSREVKPGEPAVLTIGSMSAGTRPNIIPDDARLSVDIRSFSPQTRATVLAAVERIVAAEAAAAGAPRPPDIRTVESLPTTVNDHDATARVVAAFGARFGADALLELPASLGSEDFGVFGRAAGVPSVFWFFGGGDAARYARAEQDGRLAEDVPSNHSPLYAPVVHPTLATGVSALVVAALDRLTPRDGDGP